MTQLTVKDAAKDGTPTSQQITVKESQPPTTQLTVKDAAEDCRPTSQQITHSQG